MQIWPAIDLLGGKCVRLRQGDYDCSTVFSDDPAAMAEQWVAQGARCLHLVDLDAAKTGSPTNLKAVEGILKRVDVPCQLGGGVRSEETIARLLDLGVARLVVGTAALKRPDWFGSICRSQPGHLVLGIDARDGRVASDGWTETSHQMATDLAVRFDDLPLAGIVYTDIATDGMLSGPNVRAMVEMQSAVRTPVIASGGVTSSEDVADLAATGVAGCIIGMALYEGRLTLADALAAAGREERGREASDLGPP
jgi:phosphoribosylformimino-5-aminoimidazole carboxamide ribotide isomerase